jgi:hypothetical protein
LQESSARERTFSERRFETFSDIRRCRVMSDAYNYFRAHAIAALQKARSLPLGRSKRKQRTVARVYHLLAKEAAYAPNVDHLDDFRAARRLEEQIDRRTR